MASSEVVGEGCSSGTSGRGQVGTKGDGTKELPPHIVVKLKKLCILPAKDIPLKQKKSWKMTKIDRQQGFACVVCMRPLSTLEQVPAHVKTKLHQVKQKGQLLQEYLPTIPKLSTDHYGTLTSFLTDTFHQHSATSQRDDRQSIAEQLECFLKEDGLEVTVSLFGSSGSGFALTSSNVNLNISLGGATEKQKLMADCLKSVADSLKRRSTVYINVREDYFAFTKIPRILFQHKISELRCEVRVEARNPATLCSLLRLYAEIDERCVQLAALFRLWAKLCSVDSQENGHYPGHMFVVMVIHFLQQIGILPVLHELYKKKVVVNKPQSLPASVAGSKKEVVKRGDGEGESEAEDDVVVFEEEIEGAGEERKETEGVNGSSNPGEEEEGGSANKQDIDFLHDLSELPNLWQSTENTQSLGELWYHLLKYYAVEFKTDVNAVSIRQKSLLLRPKRQWGEVRLAVEDPMIPESNLGRGSSSQQVFDYMMSSIRMSALYFSGYSDQMPYATVEGLVEEAKAVEESGEPMKDSGTNSMTGPSMKWNDLECDSVTLSDDPSLLPSSHPSQEEGKEGVGRGKEEKNIEQQDSSILFASAPSSTKSHEGLGKCADLSFLDEKVTVPPGEQSGLDIGQLSLSNTSNTTSQTTSFHNESTDAHHTQELSASDGGMGPGTQTQQQLVSSDEINDSSLASSSTPPPPSLPTAGSHSLTPHEETTLDCVQQRTNQSFKFAADNFVFQEYPVSCLNCKKLKHSILECPELHLASTYRKYLPKQLPPPASLKQIHHCFSTNMKESLPLSDTGKELLDEGHMQRRRDILISILEDIRAIYPSCRLWFSALSFSVRSVMITLPQEVAELEMFGSSANGFGSKTSDLDICLTLPGHDKNARGKIIELIAAEFAKHRKYEQIVPITSARVPIVKFYLRQWYMQCDISLENKLALRNTKLLAAYTRIDSRVPVLGCALKCLAKSCDMCDAAAGSLSSYAYILMLLHYLQTITPPVIPVLQQLNPTGMSTEEYIIDDWNCYFYEFKSVTELKEVWKDYKRNTSSSGQLWLGMLRYYTTEFDWNQDVVSIKQLKPLSKFDKWWMGKCMCIEDPFNLDHNLGGGITCRMRAYILDRFMDALRYHSEHKGWSNIRELMDPVVLKGEMRPPKFMRCHSCGNRGHKAAECPNRANIKSNQGVQNRTPQRTVKEKKNTITNKPQGMAPRQQERLVYDVGPASQRERKAKNPSALLPSSGYNVHMQVSNQPSAQSVVSPSTVHHSNPSMPIFPYPPLQYQPVMPGYPVNSVPIPMHEVTRTVAPLVNVPFSHSPTYPLYHQGRQVVSPQMGIRHRCREAVTLLPRIHYSSGPIAGSPPGMQPHGEQVSPPPETPHHGRQPIITPLPGQEQAGVLPYSVGRSPPYRQHQQPNALFHQPSQHPNSGLQTYMMQYNPPISYMHNSSAPLSIHSSATHVPLNEASDKGQRGKQN